MSDLARYLESSFSQALMGRCKGDQCPSCGAARLEFDPGCGDSFDEPGQPSVVFCPECQDSFAIDWERMRQVELAERIATDLFTNGNGDVAKRRVRGIHTMTDSVREQHRTRAALFVQDMERRATSRSNRTNAVDGRRSGVSKIAYAETKKTIIEF